MDAPPDENNSNDNESGLLKNYRWFLSEIYQEKKSIYVGNPPPEDTEEILRKAFASCGEITGIELYDFNGTLNASIKFKDKAINFDVLESSGSLLGGYRIWTNLVKRKSSFITFWQSAIVGILEDNNVSENELYDIYVKYGEILNMMKIFPNLYIKYKDSGNRIRIVDKLNADGHRFFIIPAGRHQHHIKALQTRRAYLYGYNKSIFVTNLPKNYSVSELQEMFNCGTIIHISDPKEYANNTMLYVRIVFEKAESIKNALFKNKTVYKSHRLFVFHSTEDLIQDYNKSVILLNLPKNVTDTEIFQKYSSYGVIQHVMRHNLQQPNMAIITYAEEKSAHNLILKKHKNAWPNVKVSESHGACFDYNIIREYELTTFNGHQIQNGSQKILFIGNPPEEDFSEPFKKYGIQKSVLYNYRGSRSAMITFTRLLDKSLEDIKELKGNRVNVHILSESKIESISANTLVGVLENESLTESELYEKFEKYGTVSEINKILPHIYIKYEESWMLDRIIENCKTDGIILYKITTSAEELHQKIIYDRRAYLQNNKRIIITNVSTDMTAFDIDKLFTQCGRIESINVKKYYGHETFSISVTFEKDICVNAALKRNNTVYLGRRIFVFDSFSIIPDHKSSVIVFGLPLHAYEEEIYQHFAQYGAIVSIVRHCTLDYDVHDMAIINYEKEEYADDAITNSKPFEFPERFNKPPEKIELSVKKSIDLCFTGNIYERITNFKRNNFDLKQHKQDASFVINPKRLHIANPPTEDTEAVLSEEFSKFGNIEKIETYTCSGGTFNALITYDCVIPTDVWKPYFGFELKNHKIIALPLAGKVNIVNEYTICGLLDDGDMTENEIYEKFGKYGKLLYASKVYYHVYLNYSLDENIDSIISICNANGIILYKMKNIGVHNGIIRQRSFFTFLRYMLWATNISVNKKFDQLYKCFRACGEISYVEFKKGESLEHTFVVAYKTQEGFDNAFKRLHKTMLGENRIFLTPFFLYAIPDYKCEVIVKDLIKKKQVAVNKLYDFFSQYGPIKIIRKYKGNVNAAFITFENEESATKATSFCGILPDGLSTIAVRVEKSFGLCFCTNVEEYYTKASNNIEQFGSEYEMTNTLYESSYENTNNSHPGPSNTSNESNKNSSKSGNAPPMLNQSLDGQNSRLQASNPLLQSMQHALKVALQLKNAQIKQGVNYLKNYSNNNQQKVQMSGTSNQNRSGQQEANQPQQNFQTPGNTKLQHFISSNFRPAQPENNNNQQNFQMSSTSNQTSRPGQQGANLHGNYSNNIQQNFGNTNRQHVISPNFRPEKPENNSIWGLEAQKLENLPLLPSIFGGGVMPPLETPFSSNLRLGNATPMPVPAPVGSRLKQLIQNTYQFEPIHYNYLVSRYPVYISNISVDATRQEILNLFNQYGKIVQFFFIECVYSSNQKMLIAPPTRIALAYFRNFSESQTVAQNVDQQILHGSRLNVVLGRGNCILPYNRLVHVKNLTSYITEDMLYTKFKCLGTIERVGKICNNEAYILFSHPDMKMLALHKAYKPVIANTQIIVEDVYRSVEFKLYNEEIENMERIIVEVFNELSKFLRIDEYIVAEKWTYLITGCYEKEDHIKMKELYEKHAIHWLIGAGITENLADLNFQYSCPTIAQQIRAHSTISETFSTPEADLTVIKKDDLQKLLDKAFSEGKDAGVEVATKTIGKILQVAPKAIITPAETVTADTNPAQKYNKPFYSYDQEQGKTYPHSSRSDINPYKRDSSGDMNSKVWGNFGQDRKTDDRDTSTRIKRSRFDEDTTELPKNSNFDYPYNSEIDNRFGSNTRDNFGNRQNNFRDNINSFGTNQNNFGSNQNNFKNSFGNNQNNFRNNFENNQNNFRNNFENNQNNLRDNQNSFGNNQNNRQNFGPNGKQYGQR